MRKNLKKAESRAKINKRNNKIIKSLKGNKVIYDSSI